jgi:hypothetical protein
MNFLSSMPPLAHGKITGMAVLNIHVVPILEFCNESPNELSSHFADGPLDPL